MFHNFTFPWLVLMRKKKKLLNSCFIQIPTSQIGNWVPQKEQDLSDVTEQIGGRESGTPIAFPGICFQGPKSLRRTGRKKDNGESATLWQSRQFELII